MFRRFFSALSALAGNVEALAASFAEANERFRHNVLGLVPRSSRNTMNCVQKRLN
jgi:hypothetical protein